MDFKRFIKVLDMIQARTTNAKIDLFMQVNYLKIKY
jgi:hypothetical protein